MDPRDSMSDFDNLVDDQISSYSDYADYVDDSDYHDDSNDNDYVNGGEEYS